MKFPEYHKIHSLFYRDEKTHKFTEQYSKEEFDLIKYWQVFEKINGTNIRIVYTPKTEEKESSLYIGGRTNNAQIAADVYDYLKNKFPLEKFIEQFQDAPAILFGEAYGGHIQKENTPYSKELGFVLFDVSIGKWWLERDKARDIANFFDIPMVPIIEEKMQLQDIIDLVKSKPNSIFGEPNDFVMEGIVCRPFPLLLDRAGKMIIFKLKVKDFK